MRQRVTQSIRTLRRRRHASVRRIANESTRRNTQRLTRIVSMPLLIISSLIGVYLISQFLYVMYSEYVLSQPPTDRTVSTLITPTPAAVPSTPTPSVATTPSSLATPTTLPTVAVNPTANLAMNTTTNTGIQAVRIPKIELDSHVVDVYWQEVANDQGGSDLVWQVAQYAVGHHFTSAVPGQRSNIVLSAHVGGFGKLFRRLDEITPGDRIFLYHNDVEYVYQATESIVLDEASATEVEQINNVAYINQTDYEVLTLITCWPPTGPDRFSQRLIVRAFPVSTE
jgi:LPXTG-site transpeptidase (sortase) family protein